MAFIAIDAKADVADSKKGKLTPAQHAQLNAWCLASKTGILDWGNRCESSAASYSVSGGAATVYFRKGFAVVCGRLVECEEGSSVVVAAPSVGTVNGKIILRFNLSNSGAEEFEATTKTGALVQQDLNDNATTGVYEFELYSYTATPTTVTLSRSNTDYIPDIGGKLAQFITVLTGTGMTGTGNPPLQGYDESNGTIEERLMPLSEYDNTKGTVETRLTSLGFKTGNATNLSNVSSVTLKKLGKFVVCKFTYTKSSFSFNLPSGFAPYSSFIVDGVGRVYNSSSRVYEFAKIQINVNSNGTVSASTALGTEAINYSVQIGWSVDSNYSI